MSTYGLFWHSAARISISAIAIIFIASCAVNMTARDQIYSKDEATQSQATPAQRFAGRISLVFEALPDQTAPPSFSGSFELRGDAQNGELDLFTPLGTILAQLHWSPQGASLKSGQQTRLFSSAAALIEQATGAALPPELLLAWLRGDTKASAALTAMSAAAEATGRDRHAALWEVDLSRHSEGRIVAKRLSPAPTATLRIILEQP